MKEYENGVHDISIDAYHSSAGFSRSQIVEFARSPLHFWHAAFNPEREKPVYAKIIRKENKLEFGNAVHTYMLEPELFDANYYVAPKMNLNTNVGKAMLEEAKIAANGRYIICETAYDSMCRMRKSMESCEKTMAVLKNMDFEKSIYYQDPLTELQLKARPDALRKDLSFVVDLKTTESAEIKDFTRSVFKFSYHIQCAMIQQACEVIFGETIEHFLFLCVEKTPPYAYAVHRLDDCVIDYARQQLKNMLIGISTCIDNEFFPSYAPATIPLPNYIR